MRVILRSVLCAVLTCDGALVRGIFKFAFLYRLSAQHCGRGTQLSTNERCPHMWFLFICNMTGVDKKTSHEATSDSGVCRRDVPARSVGNVAIPLGRCSPIVVYCDRAVPGGPVLDEWSASPHSILSVPQGTGSNGCRA